MSRNGDTTDLAQADMKREVERLRAKLTELEFCQRSLQEENARLAELTTISGDRFWETDKDHRIVKMSPPTGSLTLPSKQFIGTTFWEPPSVDLDPVAKDLLRVTFAAQQRFRSCRFTALRSDGQTLHICLHGQPIFDADGEFQGFRGVSVDETEVTSQATRSEQRLMETINNVSIGIALFDKDDKIVVCNPTLRDFYEPIADILRPGTSAREMLVAIEREMLPPDPDRDPEVWIEQVMERHRQDGSSEEREFADGRVLRIDRSHTNDGGVLDIWTDITAQKQAEALLEAQDELESRVRDQERQFLDTIESLSSSVLIYDRDEKMVFCNSKLKEDLAPISEVLVPGTSAETIMRAIETTMAPDKTRDPEAWVQAALQRQRDMVRGSEVQLATGRWIQIDRMRTADGGMMVLGNDVTEQKQAEEAVEAAEASTRLLSDTMDQFVDACSLWDPEHRLLAANKPFRDEAAAFGVADLRLGISYRDYMGLIAKDRWEPGLDGTQSPEEWIEQREAAFAGPGGTRVTRQRNGKTWRVTNQRLNDGSTVSIRSNITELMEAKERAERFADTFENLSSGVVIYDKDDCFVACNSALREDLSSITELLVPGTHVEAILRGVEAHVLAPDPERDSEAWVQGTLLDHRNRLSRERESIDGSWTRTDRLETSDGGLLVVATDITEQKRAEMELARAQRNERLLTEALDGLVDACVLWDADGNFVACNKGFRDELAEVGVKVGRGITYRQHLEEMAPIIWKEGLDECATLEDWVQLRLDLHAMPTSTKIVKRENGWLRVTKQRLEDGSVFAIRSDITEMMEAKQAAELISRSKSEFLANMSHELRTPLNAILGFSESLNAGLFGPLANDKQTEYVTDIYRSGEHLLSLINDVLDVSVVEAGKLALSESEVEVASAVESAINLLRTRASKRGVTLGVSPVSDHPSVVGDERRIKQILLNLLSNAVKFTPEGGSVTVETKFMDDGGVEIAVTDTGVGMSPDEVDHALQEFGRIEHGDEVDQEGTGLGLPLVRRLVHAHGGSLRVDSKPGQGTRVSFTLPAERVASQAKVAQTH